MTAGGWSRSRAGCLALAAAVISGCGYHFVGAEPQLPDDVRSIGIAWISNRTREHGLEKVFALAFEREVHIRRHYRLEQRAEAADAVVTGTIWRLDHRPVAFDENDQAVIYELTFAVDLRLTRQEDGKTLWRRRELTRRDEYSANPRVVVTSSSEFQRGTLDPEDLPRSDEDDIPDHEQISGIQLASSERQRAIARLMGSAVRDAYNSMVDGF